MILGLGFGIPVLLKQGTLLLRHYHLLCFFLTSMGFTSILAYVGDCEFVRNSLKVALF